jgi:hypothetical protein
VICFYQRALLTGFSRNYSATKARGSCYLHQNLFGRVTGRTSTRPGATGDEQTADIEVPREVSKPPSQVGKLPGLGDSCCKIGPRKPARVCRSASRVDVRIPSAVRPLRSRQNYRMSVGKLINRCWLDHLSTVCGVTEVRHRRTHRRFRVKRQSLQATWREVDLIFWESGAAIPLRPSGWSTTPTRGRRECCPRRRRAIAR